MARAIWLVLFFVSINIFGQNIYFSTSYNTIYRLNDDNTLTNIITVNTGSDGVINDIAISPSGSFYGIANDKIIEINLQTGSSNVLAILNVPQLNFSAFKSLVCNNNNELFALNNLNGDIYRYNITTNVIDIITDSNFNTPGDFTFYKGNLIFPSGNRIKSFDFNNFSTADIFCLDSSNILNWGISNLYTDCNTNRVLISNSNNEIRELDIENETSVILNIDITNLDGIIYGMATSNEYLASNCNFQLVNASCTLSIEEFNWLNYNIIYPNPTKDIIYLKTNINKIEIFDFFGRKIIEFNSPNGQIDLSELKDSIYLLRLYTDFGIKTEKLVKE